MEEVWAADCADTHRSEIDIEENVRIFDSD